MVKIPKLMRLFIRSNELFSRVPNRLGQHAVELDELRSQRMHDHLHDPCHCYRGPPISARTFEGSFSAVWVPTVARVGAFFHIFRDLQDSHSFAPLHTQIFVNFSFLFLQFFRPNFIIFSNFASISGVFEQILMKICWDIEKDVPDLILGVPGADSGVKNPKNPKYVTRFFSTKSAKIQKYIEI